MQLAPYNVKGVWRLDLETDESSKLADCPGLRIAPDNKFAFGAIDAVAAACYRLNRELPPKFPTNLKLACNEKARNYHKVGIGDLWSIQNDAGGGLLADDMGLGKTFQAIELARLRRSANVLVACPGLARETWLDELTKWGVPASKIALVLPKGDKRRESHLRRIPDAGWVISSFDLLSKIQELGYYTDFFIIDEAQSIKTAQRNNGANRAKLSLDVGLMAPYRLALSGTPAEDRPRDWYGILRVLFGKRFGSPSEFDIAYCGREGFGRGFDNLGISNAQELKIRLSYYMVRREKREVATELPPCTMNTILLPPDAKATATFRAFCLKLTTIDEALEACLEAKLPAALEKAHQAKRFLLFTHRVKHAEYLHHKLNEEGTPCVLVTGALSHEKRQQAAKDAADKSIGMVATIDSAGMALNLQGVSSYGIMHTVTWRPGQLLQARDRIYRLGQKDPVIWDILGLKESADSYVFDTVIEKLKMMQSAIEASKEIGRTIDALNPITSEFDDVMAAKALYDSLPEFVEE